MRGRRLGVDGEDNRLETPSIHDIDEADAEEEDYEEEDYEDPPPEPAIPIYPTHPILSTYAIIDMFYDFLDEYHGNPCSGLVKPWTLLQGFLDLLGVHTFPLYDPALQARDRQITTNTLSLEPDKDDERFCYAICLRWFIRVYPWPRGTSIPEDVSLGVLVDIFEESVRTLAEERYLMEALEWVSIGMEDEKMLELLGLLPRELKAVDWDGDKLLTILLDHRDE